MTAFWLWFIRPLAEMLGGFVVIFVIACVIAGVDGFTRGKR